MSRRIFIAGNWKMNKTAAETAETLESLKAKVAGVSDVDMLICPTFTSLRAAADALAGTPIAVGAQNVHWAESGAFTGEISAAMLREIPVPYVIIGHSERRQYFAETDETVNKRVQAALNAELKPVVCVGETLEQRESGDTETVVTTQVEAGLAGLTESRMENVTVAYEPVWAIGTGRTATPEQAQEVHALIRSLLAKRFGDMAEKIRILYGGSVKPANARELMGQPDIDGGLVGGASLKPDDFAEIVANSR